MLTFINGQMKMIPMNVRRLLTATAGFAALTVLAACGTSPTGSGDPLGQPVRVVAAVYPYQWLVEQIGGAEVQVEPLLQAGGGDTHDLELTPQQVADITQKADLVVYEQHLMTAVDAAVASGTRGSALDTGALVPEQAAPDAHAGEQPADEEHADPHVWLDPTNMVAIAKGVRDELSRIDPASADSFAANTDRMVAELTGLDEEFRAGLSQCRIKVFIPSHEAFGYLANRYGLEQVAVRGLDASVEPSAARIAEVQDIAKREGVTTIFYETAVSPAVSEAIARDSGLRTDLLDPIAAPAKDTSRGTDYPSRMRSNLTSLRTANDCR